jgi:osmotically-inducible protein OsmY
MNEITVAPSGVEPDELYRAIEEALERRAGREARRLRVEVFGDEVSLAGVVRSWAEKRAIHGAVAHSPGVRKVNDQLYVEPEL